MPCAARINSFWPNNAKLWQTWVNISSGNGLLPDGTKPLPEPMLNHHQKGGVTFIWGQFHKILQVSITKIGLKITQLKFLLKSPREQWVKNIFNQWPLGWWSLWFKQMLIGVCLHNDVLHTMLGLSVPTTGLATVHQHCTKLYSTYNTKRKKYSHWINKYLGKLNIYWNI